MSLTKTNKLTSDCGLPIIKIEGISNCYDKITGVQFSGGEKPFTIKTNIQGYIKRIPREVERQVSENCKTQSVKSSVIYEIQGGELYPEWKMNEIESLFHQRQIFINGIEVIWRGGKLFEQANKGCPPVFKFRALVEECTKQMIFRCNDVCDENNDFVILFDDNKTSEVIFDNKGNKVANSFVQFKNWLQYQSGVNAVEEITDVLPCNYRLALKINGNTDFDYFYVGSVYQYNKVYGMNLPKDLQDYTVLCRGVNNAKCGTISLGVPFVYILTCGTISLGQHTIYQISGNCSIVGVNNYSDNGSSFNQNILNINLVSTSKIGVTKNEQWQYISNINNNCQITAQIPANATINNVKINQQNASFTYNNGVIDLTNNCLSQNDILEVDFSYFKVPRLGGEVIAQLGNCFPETEKQISHYENNQIPLGSLLVIQKDGAIKWYGDVTSATLNNSEIIVNNIII